MTRCALLFLVATGCVLQTEAQPPAPEQPQPQPPPPEPPCNATELGAQTEVTGTTSGLYDWTAPVTGDYEITASGAALDVRAWTCHGTELATASTTLALDADTTIAIALTGDSGAPFALSITHVADICGDGICEASEDATSCWDDCAPPYCGDGVCDNGETCDTCATDCGTCD